MKCDILYRKASSGQNCVKIAQYKPHIIPSEFCSRDIFGQSIINCIPLISLPHRNIRKTKTTQFHIFQPSIPQNHDHFNFISQSSKRGSDLDGSCSVTAIAGKGLGDAQKESVQIYCDAIYRFNPRWDSETSTDHLGISHDASTTGNASVYQLIRHLLYKSLH